MAVAQLDDLRFLGMADVPKPDRAAGVKAATGREVQGTWNVSFENLFIIGLVRFGVGDCRELEPGVWVSRVVKKFVNRAFSYDLTKIHYGHSVTDIPDDRQVARDEEMGEGEAGLRNRDTV